MMTAVEYYKYVPIVCDEIIYFHTTGPRQYLSIPVLYSVSDLDCSNVAGALRVKDMCNDY